MEVRPKKVIAMTAVVAAGAAVLAYPVHVTADPVPDRPSRGLWLVKWLLVIPHGVVLAFLWAAFFVLSIVAFVAILVTGRYPRAIFDFNVGVLRWTWRVAYYSYGASGTDRYPPFTLREDPSYPARLDVDYPERLSRGLVLVKWWLLAIPHYLVVAVFTDAGARVARETAGAEWAWEGGLIALLVLIAGVALLFTGHYPQGIYDLLLGLNRWMLRVAGYAALMTDTYPPFRLDQGGRSDVTDTPRTPGLQTATSQWTTGRAVGVVAGSLAVLLGLGLAAGGATLLSWRSDDGYVTSPTRTVETTGYAVASQKVLLEGVGLDEGLGQVRVRAESDDGAELFVGIARADDAAAYLAGVEHTVVTGRLAQDARHVPGGPPRSAPQDSDIWAVSAVGAGRQSVEMTAQPGSWAVVIMPLGATPGVRATVDVGATLPWLSPASGVVLAIGALLLLGGAAAVALGVRAATTRRPS